MTLVKLGLLVEIEAAAEGCGVEEDAEAMEEVGTGCCCSCGNDP